MILVVAALPEELGVYFKNENVQITGVGKVNAAIGLMRGIETFKKYTGSAPTLIANFGLCGSVDVPIGHTVFVRKCRQLDMNAKGLDYPAMDTPYEDADQLLDGVVFQGSEEIYRKNGFGNARLPFAKCLTSDTFHTSPPVKREKPQEAPYVFDMECYALAKVALYHQIPFISFKFVCDALNEHSKKNFQHNLSAAQKDFWNIYQDLNTPEPEYPEEA
jgi:adenosylhomocysteine nucleosidase